MLKSSLNRAPSSLRRAESNTLNHRRRRLVPTDGVGNAGHQIEKIVRERFVAIQVNAYSQGEGVALENRLAVLQRDINLRLRPLDILKKFVVKAVMGNQISFPIGEDGEGHLAILFP